MMDFKSYTTYTMTTWINFVSGGAASITAEVCTLPLDTVKIQLQTQRKSSILAIIKQEGPHFFYRGLIPGIYRQGIYSSIKMCIYPHIRDFLATSHIRRNQSLSPSSQVNIIHRILAGGIAGACGSAFANPFDILKIQRQAQQNLNSKPRLIQDLQRLGWDGYRRGLLVNLQRSFLLNAAELAAYDTCKSSLLTRYQMSDTILTHFLSSCVAGFFAAGVSAPVDFVKTRLMSQNNTTHMYTGIMDCIIKTTKNEGFLRLYSGFIPSWLRIGPWCCIMFITWEQYKNWLHEMC